MESKVVYIAGPITGGKLGHIQVQPVVEAIQLYYSLIEGGFVPICPQLSVLADFTDPGRLTYEQWLELDFRYIDLCDAVIRVPGESPGADREVEYARSKGKIVVSED